MIPQIVPITIHNHSPKDHYGYINAMENALKLMIQYSIIDLELYDCQFLQMRMKLELYLERVQV